MPKLSSSVLILFVVICSYSILSACGSNEDDFSEFDDFAGGETIIENIAAKSVRDEGVLIDRPKEGEAIKQDNSNSKPIEQLTQIPAFGANDDRPRTSSESDDASDGGSKKKPELKLVNAPMPGYQRWETYYIEIIFLLAGFLYFACYFIGCNTNNKFARDWYEQSRDLLKQQFALVGGAPQISEGGNKRDEDTDAALLALAKQRGLIKVSESIYTLWNSGRLGVDGLLIELNLLKRQDLFSMALNFLKNTNDSLILRFLLPQDGYENFVFCLASKSQAVKLARDMIDISTFCSKRKPLSHMGINIDRLFVLSELSDVCPFILDQGNVSFLKKHERSINYIHITDQYSTIRSDDAAPMQKLANPKRMATFSFSLPKTAADRADFLLFATNLLDRLRRFKLARDSKQKSDKNRQKITDFLQKTAFSQRQEAAQAKKDELRRLEKERIYNEDDPEKQRRWEKKEAKREAKKKMRGVKQLKIRS